MAKISFDLLIFFVGGQNFANHLCIIKQFFECLKKLPFKYILFAYKLFFLPQK